VKRVLFVCIGNACRSQMAEAFARAYGSDVMIPASAGLHPATRLPSDTIRAMDEKAIEIREHFPKSIKHLGRVSFDLIVNMSGFDLPSAASGAEERDWDVADPIYMTYEEHCEVRDEIERLVMSLILEFRQGSRPSRFQGQGSIPPRF
jgi:arsenate reductase